MDEVSEINLELPSSINLKLYIKEKEEEINKIKKELDDLRQKEKDKHNELVFKEHLSEIEQQKHLLHAEKLTLSYKLETCENQNKKRILDLEELKNLNQQQKVENEKLLLELEKQKRLQQEDNLYIFQKLSKFSMDENNELLNKLGINTKLTSDDLWYIGLDGYKKFLEPDYNYILLAISKDIMEKLSEKSTVFFSTVEVSAINSNDKYKYAVLPLNPDKVDKVEKVEKVKSLLQDLIEKKAQNAIRASPLLKSGKASIFFFPTCFKLLFQDNIELTSHVPRIPENYEIIITITASNAVIIKLPDDTDLFTALQSYKKTDDIIAVYPCILAKGKFP